jgi:hypothetical protein
LELDLLSEIFASEEARIGTGFGKLDKVASNSSACFLRNSAFSRSILALSS